MWTNCKVPNLKGSHVTKNIDLCRETTGSFDTNTLTTDYDRGYSVFYKFGFGDMDELHVEQGTVNIVVDLFHPHSFSIEGHVFFFFFTDHDMTIVRD